MCGSKTVNNTTTTNSAATADLPAWAKPYFERNIAKAEAEFGKPYEAYTGNRLAGADAATLQSRQQMEGVAGTGLSGLAAAQDFASQGMQRATDLGNVETFTGENVAQYMSPYQQNVTDVQKQRAVEDFNRLQGARNAQAVKAGAFGGSRAAVQESLAQDQLLNRMAGIQASGQQQAFESAARQFGADRDAQTAAGFASLEAGSQLGSELTRLGELGRQTDIQNAQLLEGVGGARTAEEQAQLDMDYQDFLAQRDFGRQQVSDMTGILSGMPIAATGTTTSSGSTTTPTQKPGFGQQVLGAGLSGLSLYKAFG